LKKFLLIVAGIIILLIVIITINTIFFKSKQTTSVGERKIFPVDTVAVRHLSEAIQYATISYDEEDPMHKRISNATIDSIIKKVPGWHTPLLKNAEQRDSEVSMFYFFHKYLKEKYPLTFQNLSSQIINTNSLLLHWKGSENKKPVILYAHMDVVPAFSDSDSASWSHPPFEGESDGRFIYGRGAIDDKGSVIAILESIEKLLQKKFIPSRDIYIAFGHDEEAGGLDGAKRIAEELEKEGVKAEFLLDEGGLVAIDMVPFVSSPVALVFTSEKGYLTLNLSVKSNGGHSSFPPKDPPVEILSNAIREIHMHPFGQRVTDPLSQFMEYAGPEMRFPFKALFANQWLFKSVILNEYAKIPSGNAMTRTTAVATKIRGGEKENVIPTEVNATINFRLLPGDNSKDIIESVKEIIHDDRVSIKIVGDVDESSGISSTQSEGFKILQKSIHQVFPDAIVAPSLMIAQTDSRHFRKVTENIFRFLPVRMNDEILDSMHGKNEKIGIAEFMESIEFYKTLLMNL
jgi:carboxypeptidase PM20D1